MKKHMELITVNLGTSTRRIRLRKGHKGLNNISILFLKLIIGYTEVQSNAENL